MSRVPLIGTTVSLDTRKRHYKTSCKLVILYNIQKFNKSLIKNNSNDLDLTTKPVLSKEEWIELYDGIKRLYGGEGKDESDWRNIKLKPLLSLTERILE